MRTGALLGVWLVGFGLLQVYLPLGTAVQIGADEGFELGKATLWLHGHTLYREVWNDQPPLHTFLVSPSSGDRSGLGRFLLNAAVCAASAGFTLVVVDLLIEGGGFLSHFGQTWGSHFGPRRSFEYGSPADHPFDWSLLLKNWDLTLPAAVGVIFGFRRRHQAPEVLFPVAWLGWIRGDPDAPELGGAATQTLLVRGDDQCTAGGGVGGG